MNKPFIIRKLGTEILDSAQYYHVITITGPRQSGKTTLCKELFPSLPYVNLENAESLLMVEQDPVKFIASHPNGVIIDEAHHFPKIFSYIQVAVDDDIYKGKTDRKFIVTGSSNFTLLENITQSLAGRTAALNLLPLSLQELSEEERINLGKEPKLYFYRDQSQREIDVIRMQAQFLETFEIKSAMSLNRDFFKHLNYFKGLLGDRVTRSAVIYDGTNPIDQPIEGVYNFRNFRLDE